MNKLREKPETPGHQELATRLRASAPWLMGILNITPDSFSDGGSYLKKSDAIAQAEQLVESGAQIIDIGAEATGPGSQVVSEAEEIERLSQTVEALSSKYFVSIDTYKANTAKHCLELGAQMINDVSALRADPNMAEVIKEHGCFVVLMFSKESELPHVSESSRSYEALIDEISEFLKRRVDFASRCGIAPEKIIVDPGMGRYLSEDPRYSWELLQRLDELAYGELNCPLLIGTSRKGFLGSNGKHGEIQKSEVQDRDPLSQLTALAAQLKGASIIRTHNVRMAREFSDVWDKLWQKA